VSQYPAVSSLIETSKEYYQWGKEKSTVVAFAENKLETGLNYLAPKVEGVLESETYKNYAKPLLVKADGLANTALDSVENNAARIKANLESTKDKYTVAFQKLQELTLRTPPLEHTLDLIKYAQQSLEGGLQSVQKGVGTGVTMVKEAPKEVKEKIHTATQDAIAALHTAVDVLSKQFPQTSTKLHELKEAALAKKEGETEVSLFSSLAQTSSTLLHEVGSTISEYTSKGEALPQQIYSTAYGNIHKVLAGLLAYVDQYKPSSEESKEAANPGGDKEEVK
jgi:chaperonin cofactor prefoldin